MTILTFKNLTKVYPDGTQAVDNFNLEVSRGELIVLIGPSGCGKSTTLRMVNRLIESSSGSVEIEGKDFKAYPPVALRRKLGYVIQQIGLMPHFTIAENISFVLKLQGVPKARRRERAIELLKIAGLEPEVYLDKYPRELSGGQQQRIGVLRALAHDPDIILMDEPFGALDPITREQLQDELKRLQKSFHKTILFVTHDMDEALRLADRIVIMRQGHIVQVATPEEMLRAPADEFVADFIGRQRLLRQASDVSVGEVMVSQVVKVQASTGLAQTLEMMRRRRVDSIMVVDDNGKYVGVASLSDIQKSLRDGVGKPIQDYAKHPDIAVQSEATVLPVIHGMLVHRLDAVPVVDEEGKVVGVVTRGALVGVLDDVLNAGDTATVSEESSVEPVIPTIASAQGGR